jgi:RHS repeat-associated protein
MVQFSGVMPLEISNNRTPAKLVLEDNLQISSDPNAPQLYSKLKLSDGNTSIDIMSFSYYGTYKYEKLTGTSQNSGFHGGTESEWLYSIDDEGVTLNQIVVPYDKVWVHDLNEDRMSLEHYEDGSLKRITKDFQSHENGRCLDFIEEYEYEYDAGYLTIITDYRASSYWPYWYIDNEVLLRKTATVANADGAVIQQSTTTYETTLDGAIFNSSEQDPVYMWLHIYDYCFHAGGGGATETQYYYTDENYPFKPTMIVEHYDNDSNSLVNESTRTKTMEYDSRGNLVEERSYIDSTYYVLTQYGYHNTYDFPVKKTTWQGYCYDDGQGNPVTSGAKVEQQWLYGDPNGTVVSNGYAGDFLVQEKTLLDETADEWAVTAYEYYPLDDLDGLFEDGQIRIKDVSVDSQSGSISYYEYDPNGFPSKEWNGVLAFDGTTGKPVDPQTSQPTNPQKRYRFNSFGFKVLEADYLGKVMMYVYGDAWIEEERKYFDDDAMSLSDANFVPLRYDDPSTSSDDEEYESCTTYDGYHYFDKPAKQILPTGGTLWFGYFHDGETVVQRGFEEWGIGPGDFSIACGDDGRPLVIRKVRSDSVSVYTYIVYDSMNRPLHKYEYEYDFSNPPGGLLLHGVPQIKHSEFGYYGTGQKSYEKIYKVTRTENDQGYPAFTSTTEKYTRYYYDALDRLIMQVEDPNDSDPNNCLNITTQYGYDALGNRVYVVDPKGNVIFTDYDSANRKIREYFAETPVYYQGTSNIDFDSTYGNAVARKEVEYYRDGKAKKVTSYDYDGTTVLSYSEYTYDSRGRINQVKQQIDTTPAYAITSYDYYDEPVSSGVSGDPNYYHICITDAEGKETWIELTPDAKPAKILYPSGDYEKIEYYGYGLPKAKYVWDDQGDANKILYEYDAFGKLSKVIYPDDPDTQEDESGTLEYEYTARTIGEYGKIKRIVDNRCDADRPGDPNSTYTFDYFDWSGNLASYTDYAGFTTTYDYNTAWNRKTQVKVVNPSDKVVYLVDYSYDLAGRLAAVSDSNSLNPQYIAGFEYDDNGNRTGLDYYLDGTLYGNKYGMDYMHNADNLLTNIATSSTFSGTPVFIFDADDPNDIDGTGRLVHSDETIYPDTSGVSHAFDYTYDMMSQLTSAKASNIDELGWIRQDFAYNKDGNITDCNTVASDASVTETGYSYTNSGDSDIMAGATGDGAFTLSNDENGNTTKLPTASANDVVEYNWDNRMRSASKGSDSIAVKYDPMGNRVWRQSYDGQNTTTKKYVVDISGSLPTIIAEYSDPNSFTNSYVYADGQVLVQYAYNGDPNVPDDKYYYVHDRLGSVRMVVDANSVAQTVTARNVYTYSPFGNPYADTVSETVYNPFQFTGQWFDEEINQYYLRARMYDPTMMRFTTRDPARGKGLEPLTLHRYLYCSNNAVNLVDWTGEFSFNEIQWVTVLSTSLDGLVLGALGGLMEGLLQETIDWGNGEGFSWADVGWSTAGGAAAGLVQGLMGGVFIGRAAEVKTWGQGLFNVATGFAGGLASTFVQEQKGVTRVQASNAVHVISVNAMIASIEVGW